MTGSKTKDSTNRINFLFSISGGFAPQTLYLQATTRRIYPYKISYNAINEGHIYILSYWTIKVNGYDTFF